MYQNLWVSLEINISFLILQKLRIWRSGTSTYLYDMRFLILFILIDFQFYFKFFLNEKNIFSSHMFKNIIC